MRLKKIVLLFATLLFASLCWGQNMCHVIDSDTQMCTNYNIPEPVVTFSDNHSNATSINVWHQMPSSPALAKFASGFDVSGNVMHFGNTSAGDVWEYLDYMAASNPNTWVQHPEFGTVTQFAYDGYGNIYALGTSTCSGGGHPFWHWNGSSWQVPGSGICLTQFSPALDGSQIAGIDPGGNWHVSWNGGQTWANEGGGYLSVTSVSALANTYLLVKADHSVVLWKAGTIKQLSGVSAASVASDGALSRIYALGTDGYIHHYTGSNWQKLAGSGFSSLSTCDMVFCTFALSSSGTAYRFPEQAANGAVTLTGNTTCQNHLGGAKLCPTSTHTGSVTAHFLYASLTGGSTVSSAAVSPETMINITAQDTIVDPFQCLDAGYDFQQCMTPSGPAPQTGGAVICSLFATIWNTGHIPIPIAGGFKQVTHVRLSGPPSLCAPTWDGTSNSCFYPVAPSCPNPGPYMFTESAVWARQDVADAPPPGGPVKYWIAFDDCFKFQDTGWTCIPLGNLNRTAAYTPKPCDTANE